MDPLGCGEVLLCLVFGVAESRLAKWASPSLYFEMLVSWTGCKAGLGNSTFTAVLELETARQRPSRGPTEAISTSPPRHLRTVAFVSFPSRSQCPSQPESTSNCLWLRAGAQGSSEKIRSPKKEELGMVIATYPTLSKKHPKEYQRAEGMQ